MASAFPLCIYSLCTSTAVRTDQSPHATGLGEEDAAPHICIESRIPPSVSCPEPHTVSCTPLTHLRFISQVHRDQTGIECIHRGPRAVIPPSGAGFLNVLPSLAGHELPVYELELERDGIIGLYKS